MLEKMQVSSVRARMMREALCILGEGSTGDGQCES